jgi:hypothetical protein
MLTEEALILLATLVASGLLALGVMELAWPSTSGRHVRRPRPSPLAPRIGTEEPSAAAPETPVVAAPSTPAEPTPARRPPRAGGDRDAARLRVLPIDTCLAMYRDRRFADVVSLGSAALEVHARLAAVSHRPHEAAALLDLVGLSRQELGDRDGARAAFRAAIRDGEPALQATYVAHLVTLVASVLDDGASDSTDGATDVARVRDLREYAAALGDAAAAAPGDEGVAAAQAGVRDALLPPCDRLAAGVVAGAADDEARAFVLHALADDAMPAAWRERVREQLAAASSAEIGQLTAQAPKAASPAKPAPASKPTPRLANGKPDLNGTYFHEGGVSFIRPTKLADGSVCFFGCPPGKGGVPPGARAGSARCSMSVFCDRIAAWLHYFTSCEASSYRGRGRNRALSLVV